MDIIKKFLHHNLAIMFRAHEFVLADDIQAFVDEACGQPVRFHYDATISSFWSRCFSRDNDDFILYIFADETDYSLTYSTNVGYPEREGIGVIGAQEFCDHYGIGAKTNNALADTFDEVFI